MRRLFPIILKILLSGSFLYMLACTPASCYEDTISLVNISFYDSLTTKLKAPDSLTIYGLGMDSAKIYNKAGNIQPALLPLNPANESSIFIIRINGTTDTLELRYSSFPHLISKECGYSYYHTLDTTRIFTNNAIINVYYGNRNISTLNEENIRIFY